jgi:hypothetical protein
MHASLRGLGASTLLAAVFAAGACSSKSSAPAAPDVPQLSLEQLRDPEECARCHAEHYASWSLSMHAFAADDPLFLAANARGQRETKGALGVFCVRCHAPVAVALGLTTDGLNLASLPKATKGITCYACHSVDRVDAAHDAAIHYASDGVLRAGIADPAPGAAHASAYSALHDREQLDSARLCGSCHDVQNANAVPLARTYAEWQGSIFAHDDPTTKLTCAACHMPGHDGAVASTSGAPKRRVHDHAVPGVDLFPIDAPAAAAQRALVQAALDPSLATKLCVQGQKVTVTLDDAFAGHAFPSGAAYHRRAWVELVASRAGADVWSMGQVADDRAATDVLGGDTWLLADRMKDAAGAPVEQLWTAASYASNVLLPAVTTDKSDPRWYHAMVRDVTVPVPFDRLSMRVRIRAVDYDFVDDLIASGDLPQAQRSLVTTLTIGSSVHVWSSAIGVGCAP